MNEADRQRVQDFLNEWQGSQRNERANYQGFFRDLCDALGVARPPPKGNIAGDPYCFDKFDKDIQVIHKGAIAENLERLEWFGMFICRKDNQIKRWQFAELQQAS
jgi:hypothetical protein